MVGSKRYEHQEESNVAEKLTELSQRGLLLLTPSTAQAAEKQSFKKKRHKHFKRK